MDAVVREHTRALGRLAQKVIEAIESVRGARAEEASVLAGGQEQGKAHARRELAELAEYHALRDYFTAAEALREAIAARGG